MGTVTVKMVPTCLVFLLVSTWQVRALFFGQLTSSCRHDSQCPTFERERCVGDAGFLGLFCSKYEKYSVSGECVNKRDGVCGIRNVLTQERNDCNYSQCARCLTGSDCGYGRYCTSDKTCRRRSTGRR